MIGPVVMMKCACHVWPIATLYGWGRCGYCGEKPRPMEEDLREA